KVPELNLDLVFVGLWLGGFPQVAHFVDLPANTVAGVDYHSCAVDFAEPNKFPQSTERSRSVVMLTCQLDEPVHPQLREHRRFNPGLPVAGQSVVRRDLRRSSPARNLVELHRAESASILVFAEKPLLVHWNRIVRYGDGEPEAAGDAVGIMMVWPACNLRPSSILLAFCKSSTVTLYIFAMDVSVSPRATVCVLPAAAECDADAAEAAAVAGAGAASPIITPGRECESCCSSLRIS